SEGEKKHDLQRSSRECGARSPTILECGRTRGNLHRLFFPACASIELSWATRLYRGGLARFRWARHADVAWRSAGHHSPSTASHVSSHRVCLVPEAAPRHRSAWNRTDPGGLACNLRLHGTHDRLVRRADCYF